MVEDDPGSGPNTANNDDSGVPGDHIPVVQAEIYPMGLLDWLHYPTFMGCDGGVLSPMAIFLPQSNIFLALGCRFA